MSETIRIITRGDDLGSSHSANVGIKQASGAGLLKNISIMVTGPFIEEAAEMFAGKSEFCFGLHATLNAEWDSVKWGPVLPPQQVPSLVDEHGFFWQTPQSFRRSSPRIQEIMAELQAQLEKARHLGFDIRYVDSHMMLEWYVDGLEDRLGLWAAQEGLLYHAYYNRQLLLGERTADPLSTFLSRLKSLSPGQYLFVAHPAVDSREVRALGNKTETGEQIAATRSMDIRLYTDPRVLLTYQEHDIVPIRYDQAEKVQDRLSLPPELTN